MAGTVKPPVFQLLGGDGPTFYLSTDANPPSHAGDGTFKVGDVVWNSAPTAGGVLCWVVTGAGNGATATFKTVVISA